ncbi:MAG: helix-turn-helix transcriptional regulator [Eggerthellaceae bacterium]|nr:helix-turn-helix transcriptional regulator [Eggerthellaceae bacterium]
MSPNHNKRSLYNLESVVYMFGKLIYGEPALPEDVQEIDVKKALCYTIIFTEYDANTLASIIPSQHRRPFKEFCNIVAQKYGLTVREKEVMSLIALGRDSAYIQDKLYLSRSTVQTHRMHLYHKLGIHNKQELLDIFDKYRAGDKKTSD